MDFKFDTIYSNWIFIWFILYILKIIPFNPLFIFIIAYISITICLFNLIKNKVKKNILIKYIIINIVIKLIPIFIILYINNFKLNLKFNDILFSIILTLTYIFYILLYYNKNPLYYYKILLECVVNDDDNYKSYFSIIYDKIYLNTKKLLW